MTNLRDLTTDQLHRIIALKEQIAGLFIVECKDVDEAIEVATAVPAAWYGTVEVRPVRQA